MQLLQENSLFDVTDPTAKSKFISKPANVANAFIVNFFSLLGAYAIDKDKPALTTYLQNIKSVRLDNVTDNSDDLMLSIKLFDEAGGFSSPSDRDSVTKLIFKLKSKSIPTLDESIIQGILSRCHWNKFKLTTGSTRLVNNFVSGDYDAVHTLRRIYHQHRRDTISPFIAESLVMLKSFKKEIQSVDISAYAANIKSGGVSPVVVPKLTPVSAIPVAAMPAPVIPAPVIPAPVIPAPVIPAPASVVSSWDGIDKTDAKYQELVELLANVFFKPTKTILNKIKNTYNVDISHTIPNDILDDVAKFAFDKISSFDSSPGKTLLGKYDKSMAKYEEIFTLDTMPMVMQIHAKILGTQKAKLTPWVGINTVFMTLVYKDVKMLDVLLKVFDKVKPISGQILSIYMQNNGEKFIPYLEIEFDKFDWSGLSDDGISLLATEVLYFDNDLDTVKRKFPKIFELIQNNKSRLPTSLQNNFTIPDVAINTFNSSQFINFLSTGPKEHLTKYHSGIYDNLKSSSELGLVDTGDVFVEVLKGVIAGDAGFIMSFVHILKSDDLEQYIKRDKNKKIQNFISSTPNIFNSLKSILLTLKGDGTNYFIIMISYETFIEYLLERYKGTDTTSPSVFNRLLSIPKTVITNVENDIRSVEKIVLEIHAGDAQTIKTSKVLVEAFKRYNSHDGLMMTRRAHLNTVEADEGLCMMLTGATKSSVLNWISSQEEFSRWTSFSNIGEPLNCPYIHNIITDADLPKNMSSKMKYVLGFPLNDSDKAGVLVELNDVSYIMANYSSTDIHNAIALLASKNEYPRVSNAFASIALPIIFKDSTLMSSNLFNAVIDKYAENYVPSSIVSLITSSPIKDTPVFIEAMSKNKGFLEKILETASVSNKKSIFESMKPIYIKMLSDPNYSITIDMCEIISLGNLYNEIEPILSAKNKKELKSKIKTMQILTNIYDDTKNSVIPVKKLKIDDLKTVLAFNNLDLKDVIKDGLKPQALSKVQASQEDLDKELAKWYYKFYNNKHGRIGCKILEKYSMSLTFSEYQSWASSHAGFKTMVPMFHGTGSLAASFISRYGFTVIPKDNRVVKIAGKALGEGVYFTNVVPKALQYCNDGSNSAGVGMSRDAGTVGWFFELETQMRDKERYQGDPAADYATGGFPGDYWQFLSPEWCVRDHKGQVKFLNLYKVELIDIDDMKAIVTPYKNHVQDNIIQDVDKYIEEAIIIKKLETEQAKAITTYHFVSGRIPDVDGSLLKDTSVEYYNQYGVYIENKWNGVQVSKVNNTNIDEFIIIRSDEYFQKDENLKRNWNTFLTTRDKR